jgi:esterase
MGIPLAHLRLEAPAAAPGRTAYVLHGIFGSSRNWRGFLARFVERCPGWRAIGLDLRHHGGSRGAPLPDTLQACAEDLEESIRALGWRPDAVLAHSFGGKVALEHARRFPAPARDIWLLDSPPAAGPGGAEPPDSVVGRVLAALEDLPGPVARRGEVVTHFSGHGVAEPVARWMASSLVQVAGGYAFPFDVPALRRLLEDYWAQELRPVVEAPPAGIRIHAVIGGRSARLRSGDRRWHESLAAAGRLDLHVLETAGHWLHVDDPEGLVEVLRAGLC